MKLKDIKPLEDGIKHIRIDKHCLTHLGRQLTLDYTRVFHHPTMGTFSSLHSAIVWYRTGQKHGDLRSLTGKKLEEFVEDYSIKIETQKVPDEIWLEFIQYSILSNPVLFESLINNPLPLISYYLKGEEVEIKDLRYVEWLEKFIESRKEIPQ